MSARRSGIEGCLEWNIVWAGVTCGLDSEGRMLINASMCVERSMYIMGISCALGELIRPYALKMCIAVSSTAY